MARGGSDKRADPGARVYARLCHKDCRAQCAYHSTRPYHFGMAGTEDSASLDWTDGRFGTHRYIPDQQSSQLGTFLRCSADLSSPDTEFRLCRCERQYRLLRCWTYTDKIER